MFIFRDVLVQIPAILQGDATVVREELVPFYSFSNQFFAEGTSSLTSSEEVRVAYSFWTAWVRHDKILPFALVFMNAMSAFMLFYAFHRIGRYFARHSLFGILAAMLAALLIHTILLYAKVAHFYTLILGFSMFALAATLVCEQLFLKRYTAKRNVIAVSLLVLFNPAIHYHVIFYLFFVLVLVLHLGFTLLMNRPYFWAYAKKDLLYFLIITLISGIPYAALVLTVTMQNMSSVSAQIPVNYWMIYYASLGLPFIFSFDTAGHLDLLRYGNYLTPVPRIGTMAIALLVGSLFLFKDWRRLHLAKQVFVLSLFITLLLAIWMSIGYSPNAPFSFHVFLGKLAVFLAEQGGTISQLLAKALSVFINILRFPHRFQFIYFYAAGALLTVALIWCREALTRRMGKRALATILTVLLALFPVIGSNDYRTALTSGDLATFADPYPIPNDLKNIKQKLATSHDNKLFILPTLESGREIRQNGHSYSFLDKFLIYYLDQPTLYYGIGANTENKIMSYLIYRSIAYNEVWWEDMLIHNLGITNILVPKHIEARQIGITYMPDIDKKIVDSLGTAQKFKKTYAGNDYELYTASASRNTSSHTLINMRWDNLLKYLDKPQVTDNATYFPLQLSQFTHQQGDTHIATDSVERSFYDIYTSTSDAPSFVPNPLLLPFRKEFVASSNFTNNALSLSTLYAKEDNYNYLHEVIPSLASLRIPQFVGLTKGNIRMDIGLDVPQDGTYRILLHGASKADTVEAAIGGVRVPLQKIADDQGKANNYLDFSYFYADVPLLGGTQTIALKNTDQNAIIVESISLMPEQDIVRDFAKPERAGIRIEATDKPELYKVTLPQREE